MPETHLGVRAEVFVAFKGGIQGVKDLEFKRKVKAGMVKMRGTVAVCDTINGDRLTLDTRFQEVPTINGKPVDYAPPKVLESPFLNADYNSAVVTIRKGERRKVLDFN